MWCDLNPIGHHWDELEPGLIAQLYCPASVMIEQIPAPRFPESLPRRLVSSAYTGVMLRCLDTFLPRIDWTLATTSLFSLSCGLTTGSRQNTMNSQWKMILNSKVTLSQMLPERLNVSLMHLPTIKAIGREFSIHLCSSSQLCGLLWASCSSSRVIVVFCSLATCLVLHFLLYCET